MQIKEEPIQTDRLMHRIICSCANCKIDFTINTTCFELSEIIGTPDMPVKCPLCYNPVVVDDKEDEYI